MGQGMGRGCLEGSQRRKGRGEAVCGGENELLISCHRLCLGQDWCWAALTAKGTLDFGKGGWWPALLLS